MFPLLLPAKFIVMCVRRQPPPLNRKIAGCAIVERFLCDLAIFAELMFSPLLCVRSSSAVRDVLTRPTCEKKPLMTHRSSAGRQKEVFVRFMCTDLYLFLRRF